MTAVIARTGDEMESVRVADARLFRAVGARPARTVADRDVTPSGVRALVDRVHLARSGDDDVVRVAESRRVDLDGTAGDDLRLASTEIPTERARQGWQVVVGQRRQVVRGVADGGEIHLQDGG